MATVHVKLGKHKMEEKWHEVINKLDFAFQPIINVYTGMVYGYEALLRNYKQVEFESIQDFFDTAYEYEMLYQVDLWLREKAIAKFIKSGYQFDSKLFYNLDNRIIEMPDYSPGNTTKIIKKYNFPASSLCFEVSEKHEFKSNADMKNILSSYQHQGYKIAIDDFGAGYSGLQLFYQIEPDFIKIDQFFIQKLQDDSKKRLFITNIVNMSHVLGINVIAEGIEIDKEYYACKEMGCDFVQGYLSQKPEQDIQKLFTKCEVIDALNLKDRRRHDSDQKLIHNRMEYLTPILLDTEMFSVFEHFKKNQSSTFFPVINQSEEPVGIIKEKDLKNYVYSPYGKDIIQKRALRDFISKAPVAEVNTVIEKILEIFTQDENSEGVLITANGQYLGFLSAKSLLKVINEKNLAIARDQNPLTKLPGNNVITDFVREALTKSKSEFLLVYFDFDNFKPFNDRYGFRQGDRAILLFKEILIDCSKDFHKSLLTAHVGGDDFFIGIELEGQKDFDVSIELVQVILDTFKSNVKELYLPEDKERGYIISKDREGRENRFPLLTTSSAVLHLPADERAHSVEDLSPIFGQLKKSAKKSSDKLAMASLFNSKTIN